MKIKHFLYNTFVVESGGTKIAIDPGLDTWIFRFRNLIPKSEWPEITHILVTHGDIDHYWSPDRIADLTGAHLVCGKDLARREGNQSYDLDPRSRDIRYSTRTERVSPLDVGDVVMLAGVQFEAYKAVHGLINLPGSWRGVSRIRKAISSPNRAFIAS
jgi:glyoxylase-like metal-dependent hydrolase (beta-lactamase superfamily II)